MVQISVHSLGSSHCFQVFPPLFHTTTREYMLSDYYLLPNIEIYYSPLMLSFVVMYCEIQVLVLWVPKLYCGDLNCIVGT